MSQGADKLVRWMEQTVRRLTGQTDPEDLYGRMVSDSPQGQVIESANRVIFVRAEGADEVPPCVFLMVKKGEGEIGSPVPNNPDLQVVQYVIWEGLSEETQQAILVDLGAEED